MKDPKQIPSLLESKDIDVILLDRNFSADVHSDNEGIYWLRKILSIDRECVVILITAYGDVELAMHFADSGHREQFRQKYYIQES